MDKIGRWVEKKTGCTKSKGSGPERSETVLGVNSSGYGHAWRKRFTRSKFARLLDFGVGNICTRKSKFANKGACLGGVKICAIKVV